MTRALVAACVGVACLTALAPNTEAADLSSTAHGVPISRCTAHQGTIIAVDFARWEGPVVRGCALNQPTGYRLLHAVGFTTAGDQHDGPAFICRIGDTAFDHGSQHPTPAQDACVLTPPASAYWSYWLAPSGQNHWNYSQLGAMSEVPKPGEVELWIFGGTNIAGTRGSGIPPFTPNELRASDHRSKVGVSGPPLADALPTAEHASSRSAAPLVIVICLTLGLCAAAGLTVWRRRLEQ
jgi:hypothetical protein